MLEEERLKAILEGLLLAAGSPVSLAQLVNALETVPRDTIRLALADLASNYAANGRGILLEEVANGYQLRTAKEHAFYIRRLLAAKPPRLSRPLLETVAIIAYRQPVTRPEIEQLRGVDCGGVIDTLLERHLIKIGGRKDAPGRPVIYVTTSEFLEAFSLKDLSSLPDLEEFRAVDEQRLEERPLFDHAIHDAEQPPEHGAGTGALIPGDAAEVGTEGTQSDGQLRDSASCSNAPRSPVLNEAAETAAEHTTELAGELKPSQQPAGDKEEDHRDDEAKDRPE
jgi:segregation and condensation protein B